jgi:hypothetical protein
MSTTIGVDPHKPIDVWGVWESSTSRVWYLVIRDYHGWIQMDLDKYPWMVDKFLWIWMISMDYPHHSQN